MKKIILDFSNKLSADEIHGYMAQELEFPEYYGNNLDALHDCLTEIGEPTCIGIFNLDAEKFGPFIEVMKDSEQENPQIAFIFDTLEANLESDL